MTDSITAAAAPARPLLYRAATGALAVVGVVSLAACGSAGGAAKSASPSTTLSIGYNGDPAPQGYDPLLYAAGQRFFFESLYQSLFVQKADGSVAPQLAKSFTYNASKTQMTITLKSGVKFTDGSSLTGALVKANLDRRDNSKLVSYGSFATKGSAEIKSVTAPSASTVVLNFAAPQATFETQLAGEAGMIVGQKGVASAASLATTPDGSGPYALDNSKTTKSNSYTVVRTASADKSVYPYTTLVYKNLTEAQARANAAISGQVDVALIDPSTASFVKSRGTAMVSNGGTILDILNFDKAGITSKPFGDKRVRLALSYAIDRTSLVNALHKGSRATANAFPKASAGYDPALDTKYAYNVATAKQLLAQAGYAKGFSFNVTISPDQQADFTALQKQWKAIGVTMNVHVTTSTDELFSAVTKQPIGLTPLGIPNEVGITAGVLVGGFSNLLKAKDPVVEQALGAASNATGSNRAAALKALNDALVNEAWVTPVAEEYAYVSYDKAKVSAPVFPGLDNTPLLASLHPVG